MIPFWIPFLTSVPLFSIIFFAEISCRGPRFGNTKLHLVFFTGIHSNFHFTVSHPNLYSGRFSEHFLVFGTSFHLLIVTRQGRIRRHATTKRRISHSQPSSSGRHSDQESSFHSTPWSDTISLPPSAAASPVIPNLQFDWENNFPYQQLLTTNATEVPNFNFNYADHRPLTVSGPGINHPSFSTVDNWSRATEVTPSSQWIMPPFPAPTPMFNFSVSGSTEPTIPQFDFNFTQPSKPFTWLP